MTQPQTSPLPSAGAPAQASPELGELLDRLTAIVWEADPVTLRLTFISRHAEELLHYPLARWLEEPGFRDKTVHPDDRARVRDELLHLGPGDHVLEYRLVRADGLVVHARDLVHVVGDWQGRQRGIYGVLIPTEVSEERVEAAALPGPAPEKVVEAPVEGLDLDGELVRHDRALRSLVGSAIELSFGLGLDDERVSIDAADLERLLLDLCLEARDSMLQGGAVTITTGIASEAPALGPGRYALLAVRDTGVGIDAVLRARVFESLFSVAPSLHTPTATGLHRAREIVAAAAGEFVVTSLAGQGSCFEVYLPLAGDPVPARL